jgi:hypothetical protein
MDYWLLLFVLWLMCMPDCGIEEAIEFFLIGASLSFLRLGVPEMG